MEARLADSILEQWIGFYPLATRWTRSTGMSNVEDIAGDQIRIENTKKIWLLKWEGTFPLQIVETLNDLVNDGSNVSACMKDLISPPKLTLEINHCINAWTQKALARSVYWQSQADFVLVAEGKYVTDIRSAMIFAKNYRVLSSKYIAESVLDENNMIEHYMSQSWNLLHDKSFPR